MQALSILTFIGIIFFMIINLVIYHKIFSVTYFNLGKGCFMELFFAWLLAMVEVGIIMRLGGSLLQLLGIVGKLLLIVLVIVLAILIIYRIVQMVKGKEGAEETGKPDSGFIQSDQEANAKKEPEDATLAREETTGGEVDMEEEEKKPDIELKGIGPEKVKVGNDVRETINISLTGAKDFVESSAETLKRIAREKADDIKNRMKAEGAKVNMKLSQGPETAPEKQNNIHMIACTSCGRMINEDVKFCNFCGNKIIKMDITVCSNCGKPITGDANFCHYCGEKIRKDSGYDL